MSRRWCIWNYPIGGVLEMVLAVVILVSMLIQPGLGQARQATARAATRPLTNAVLPLPAWQARLPPCAWPRLGCSR